MTRGDIEKIVKSAMGRKDDPSIDDLVSFWFQVAHRDVQRPYTFSSTKRLGLLNIVAGSLTIPRPLDYRESIIAGIYVQPGLVSPFYNLVNIETVRERFKQTTAPDGYDDYETYLYASFGDVYSDDLILVPSPITSPNGMFIVWPPFTETMAVNNKFALDYYAWIEPPEAGAEDWFTKHGFDFFYYHMLSNSILPLGMSQNVIGDWDKKTAAAYNKLMSHDVSAKTSGPLRSRV